VTKRKNGYEDAASPSGGPATDARNMPVVDPTANVLAVIQSANRRQDDLREMSQMYEAKIADLRASHATDISEKETARIDAIRAVDTGAVTRAAEVAAAQAATLQVQVVTTAEAARVALAAALEPIQKDIAELRKTQYEQQGQRAQQAEGKTDKRDYNATLIGILALIAIVASAVIGHLWK
jgi:hypothetical protein